MPITKQNLMRHELIGLKARVENSSDPTLLGIHGTIIDETRDMLVIEQAEGTKTVLKGSSKFMFTLPGGEEVEVEGVKLVGRTEERVRRR